MGRFVSMKHKLFSYLVKNFPQLFKLVFKYTQISATPFQLINLSNELNIKIDVVYDIGANNGAWSKSKKKIFPNADFILFEANPVHGDSLKESGFTYYIEILSDKIKTVNFYEINGTGDSYYKENSSYYDNVKPISKKTNTLDSLISNNNLKLPDFIKLDTQGSELDILSGGINALNHAKFVLTECNLLDCNIGSPKIQDYIEFFTANNFAPIEIGEKHYGKIYPILTSDGPIYTKILNQIDLLFINRNLQSPS